MRARPARCQQQGQRSECATSGVNPFENYLSAGGTVPKPSAGGGEMITLFNERPGAIFGAARVTGGASGVAAGDEPYGGPSLVGVAAIGADAVGYRAAGSGRQTNTTREMPAPITIQ